MKKKVISIALLAIILLTIAIPRRYIMANETVKISKKKAVLEVDATLTLKITGTDSAVKWKSSNKKIAKVSSKGKVTALKEGNVTITATSNGNKYTCVVTVVNSNKDEVSTPTPTPTPKPTPTPTPTPKPKKEKVIEITLDNWQDYFEIADRVEWKFNGFGEFENVHIYTEFELKNEYVDKLAKSSEIAVGYSIEQCDAHFTVDPEKRTYEIGDVVRSADRRTSTLTYKADAYKIRIGWHTSIFCDSFYLKDAKWEGVGGSYSYLSIDRIQGTLYLYE